MRIPFKKSDFTHALLMVVMLTVFFGGSQEVFAQTGDSIVKCGNGPTVDSACKVGNIKEIVTGALALIISIGLPLLFVFVTYRFVMAWFSLQQGNTNAYKDAIQKAGNAIFGFFIVVVIIGGGLYTMLSFFGVKPEVLKILQILSSSDIFTHTYAQEKLLPNYGPGGTLYEFILNAVKLIMKFFIYPALIVIWVWTGFSFVMAQGAPEALTKAKKWLMWAFVTTLIIMVLQGFLFALRNSINKILGKTAIHCPVDHKRIYS